MLQDFDVTVSEHLSKIWYNLYHSRFNISKMMIPVKCARLLCECVRNSIIICPLKSTASSSPRKWPLGHSPTFRHILLSPRPRNRRGGHSGGEQTRRALPATREEATDPHPELVGVLMPSKFTVVARNIGYKYNIKVSWNLFYGMITPFLTNLELVFQGLGLRVKKNAKSDLSRERTKSHDCQEWPGHVAIGIWCGGCSTSIAWGAQMNWMC